MWCACMFVYMYVGRSRGYNCHNYMYYYINSGGCPRDWPSSNCCSPKFMRITCVVCMYFCLHVGVWCAVEVIV